MKAEQLQVNQGSIDEGSPETGQQVNAYVYGSAILLQLSITGTNEIVTTIPPVQ